MTAKAEIQGSRVDTVKLTVAVGLLAAAVGAFYYYADQSLLLRVLGLLAVAVVSGAIAAGTGQGRQLLAFVREARTEVRKVVWPTRQETLQTTFAVFVMVVLVAIMLWLVDMLLGWLVRLLVG